MNKELFALLIGVIGGGMFGYAIRETLAFKYERNFLYEGIKIGTMFLEQLQEENFEEGTNMDIPINITHIRNRK